MFYWMQVCGNDEIIIIGFVLRPVAALCCDVQTLHSTSDSKCLAQSWRFSRSEIDDSQCSKNHKKSNAEAAESDPLFVVSFSTATPPSACRRCPPLHCARRHKARKLLVDSCWPLAVALSFAHAHFIELNFGNRRPASRNGRRLYCETSPPPPPSSSSVAPIQLFD